MTQGENLARLDHHHFEGHESEFDNPQSRNPVFELVTSDLLSSGVSEVFLVECGERMSLVLIRTGSYLRPLPLRLHSFNTSILRVFVCSPELDLQGTQEKGNVKCVWWRNQGRSPVAAVAAEGAEKKQYVWRKSLVWVIRLESKESAKTRRLVPWFHTDNFRQDGLPEEL